jgi:RNA polymerase subunit RPABC4/transcription elongation factor Spt4
MTTCNSCGTINETNTTTCINCGKQLNTSTAGLIAQKINDDPSTKNAIIAIILNFVILWGLGYWYLGIKRIYGYDWYYLIVAQILFCIISIFIPHSGIVYLAANLALAYDLYEKASAREGLIPTEKPNKTNFSVSFNLDFSIPSFYA